MPDIMGKMDIAFPNLHIYFKNVPKSINIFGFEIALYGIIIGIGMLLAVLLVSKIAEKTKQNADDYWDLAVVLIIFSIIGARIYYVFFAWDYYKDNLMSVFYIRNGGLAIYGGVIAGFITLAVYVKIRKKSYRVLADTAIYGVILGQIIGRWGNFTNREAFGQYTDGLFAMRIPTEMVRANEITESIAAHMTSTTNYIQVHPTFLYESLWNLGVLILMLLYLKHKKFHGEITLMYFAGYGLGRFWIESLRTDQLWIPGTEIPVSQVLAACLVVFAVVTDIIARVRLKKYGGKLPEDVKADEITAADYEKWMAKKQEEENRKKGIAPVEQTEKVQEQATDDSKQSDGDEMETNVLTEPENNTASDPEEENDNALDNAPKE